MGLFFFLYHRGYFIGIRRMVKARQRHFSKSQVSYPVEDKIILTQFPAAPAASRDDKHGELILQRRDSVNSLTKGPQWNNHSDSNIPSARATGQAGLPTGPKPNTTWSVENRRSAPLPPTPSRISRPPQPPPKDNPFDDPASGNNALDDLDKVLRMER